MLLEVTKLLALLWLWLHAVSGGPIAGDDARARLAGRQMPCGPGQSFGCIPLPLGLWRWRSFPLRVPFVGDPHTANAQSAGRQVRASVWNRDDGTAFLSITLVEGYEPRLPALGIEVQAWIGPTQIPMRYATEIRHFWDISVATVAADILEPARNASSPRQVVITIRWRFIQ